MTLLMKNLGLGKRFIASFMDKFAIIFVFICISYFCLFDSGTESYYLGSYSSLITYPYSEYAIMDRGEKYMKEHNIKVKSDNEKIYTGYFQMRLEEAFEQYGKLSREEIDAMCTSCFVVVNILYYLLSEMFLGASPFKCIMRGKVYEDEEKKPIGKLIALKRAIIFGVMLILFVALRFLLDVSYIFVIVLFFLVYDIPVFFKRKNLLDIITSNTLVEETKNRMTH